MTSSEIQWARERIATDRARAGVSDTVYDVSAARASLTPLELELPAGTREQRCSLDGLGLIWVVAPEADPGTCIVYLHGGGYLAGGYHSHRPLVAWLSHHARAPVLFVDYRLAPEHRFPAALDDACRALDHAWQHGPDGVARRSPSRIVVGGDSAGGGIAIATLLRRRSAGQPLPAACFSLCGMLDLDETTSRFLQSSQRTRDSARLVVHWLRDLHDPCLSVIGADLAGLPPLLLQTGSEDYCREDSVRMAERAREAGVATTLEVCPGMFHVWQRFAPTVPESMEALERVGAFCRTHAASPR